MPEGVGYPSMTAGPVGATALPGQTEMPAQGGGEQFGPFRQHVIQRVAQLDPARKQKLASAVMMAPAEFAEVMGPEFTQVLGQLARMASQPMAASAPAAAPGGGGGMAPGLPVAR